jgi:hypothetical protein
VLHPFRGGSTWYASLISLNCFSANSLRSGFLSGCHFSAALLYLRCGRFGCSALLQGADALRARTRAHWRLTLFRWPSCRSPFPRPALRSSTAASRVSLTPRTLANFLFAEPGSQPLRDSSSHGGGAAQGHAPRGDARGFPVGLSCRSAVCSCARRCGRRPRQADSPCVLA